MSVAETRYTAAEWTDRLARPLKDRRYQSTRTGVVVAQEYLPWKRLSAAPSTLDQYERDLARGCNAFPDRGITDWSPADLIQVLNLFPTASQYRAKAAWKDLFKWAVDWGHVEHQLNPARLLPKIAQKSGRVYDIFGDAERQRILHAQDDSLLPERNRLGALIFQELGVRREEARLLQPPAFDLTARCVVVLGKGNKERVVPFGDEFFVALMEYLHTPIPRVRTPEGLIERPPESSDYVFFPNGASRAADSDETHLLWTDPTKPMSKTALHRWWQRSVERSGVKYRSLHMNRHTIGTDMAEADINAFAIQDYLGHASVSTTEIYVHNARRRMQGAIKQLSDYRTKRGSEEN